MTRWLVRTPLSCGALLMMATGAFAVCPESTPLRHDLGARWLTGPCRIPAGMAFAVDDPETTSTGAQPLVCDGYDGVRCFNENIPGDDAVTIEADWATPGMLGCPANPGGQRRVVVALSGTEGWSGIGGGALLASVAGSDFFPPGYYLIDFAHPWNPGGWIDDLTCSLTVQAVSYFAGWVNLYFTLPVLHSDCDPGSVGQYADDPAICQDGFNPTIERGPVYKLIQPCSQPVDIRRSVWTPTGVTPGADGRATVYVGAPPGMCKWAGSTLFIDGHETPAILGYLYVDTDCPNTIDGDGDGYSLCVDCNDADSSINPGAVEVCDGRDNNCDSMIDEDAQGVDSDADGLHNLCDNCPLALNLDQIDVDADGQGDACDPNDGLIMVQIPAPGTVAWQPEPAFDSFNVYRGDLELLRASGLYTQDPTTTPLAGRYCGVAAGTLADPPPPLGTTVFYLVTGNIGGAEQGLGTDSAGAPRPNANPCP